MQQVRAAHPIGTLILSHYLVEHILSHDGSAVMYLVKDQRVMGVHRTPINSNLLVLKELLDEDEQERDQFLFEAALLKRLQHKALPRVYDVLQNTHPGHVYQLMEYVEGISLEDLHQQQSERRFSLPQTLEMIAPIFDALIAMHACYPPIIHRAIRPSTIVLPAATGGTRLNNFGIAREYNSYQMSTASGRTYSAYGAPEQFRGESVLASDIYALGATLYTLLTGQLPIPAPQRVSHLRQTSVDPLIPVRHYSLSLSASTTEAISRALSINPVERFSSVAEFRQALKLSSPPQLAFDARQVPITPPSLPIPTIRIVERQETSSIPHHLHRPLFYSLLLLTCLTLLLTTGLLISKGKPVSGSHRATSPVAPIPQVVRHLTPAHIPLSHAASPIASLYPRLSTSYVGTIHDIFTGTSTTITLTNIQQGNANLHGNFAGLRMNATFTGVLDTSRHILFTLVGQHSQLPLFFEGAIRSDGNIVGTYCNMDAGGECSGDYGVWSVTPAQ